MKDGRLELAQMVLLPKLFRLDDLNAMPLSIVRERGINLGTAAMSRGSEWHPSITQKWELQAFDGVSSLPGGAATAA